jgi:membrane protein YdbS with pleckstrin-like domain
MDFNRVSPKWWLARQCELVVGYGIPLVVCLVLSMSYTILLLPAALFLVLFVIAWLVERGRYRRWGYAERDEDLVVRRGYLFQRMSIVPYGRMQFIDVKAGPVERAFGLATVQLHTAAAASDALIPGLPRAEAERLRDRLTSAGEASATGI